MKANNDKKVDLAKDILVAYIANAPKETLDADAVCAAAKKIFAALDELVETTPQSGTQAGFRP